METNLFKIDFYAKINCYIFNFLWLSEHLVLMSKFVSVGFCHKYCFTVELVWINLIPPFLEFDRLFLNNHPEKCPQR